MGSYVVTGGAGFIGSHLVEELLRRGQRVRVLDNFLTGKRENIAPFLDRIELIEGDVREPETCRRSLQGADGVFHQAAMPSVPWSIENPVLVHDINVTGTLNVLWASLDAKVKRFVFASSSSVYGDDSRLPQKEGLEGQPLSPYALGKWVGEVYCSLFFRLYGLETIALRYFNVFGPRQDPASQYAAAVPLFITKILSGERPIIFGDGDQSRDFTYVANVVEANLCALDASAEAAGQAFNIACGARTTVNTLARDINGLAGTSVEPEHAEPRPGDIRHSFADITKAQTMLRYAPGWNFRDGLSETVRWYQGRS